jgi:phosphatidylinositol-3-phosphatase
VRLRPSLALLAALAVWAGPAATAAPAARTPLPPIHHVYTVVLENENAATTFAPGSPAPYLSSTLRATGAYLPNYYGIGHVSLDNYIAMISGQAPNANTQTDCQVYSDFGGFSIGAYGQVVGAGCVYPRSVPTLVTQFRSAGLAWRDYNDGMGATPVRETRVCGHPAINSRDGTQVATATDQYATRHNPFVYFHSIIDDTTLCDTHVVNLDALPQDLAASDAPEYTFITPNLCNDGHDGTCANGGPGGLKQADAFLRQWVPRITGSSAYKRDGGLLIITFDESTLTDSHACCGEIAGPGSAHPGFTGPGGGDVGAVLLSPYISPRTVSQVAYNHYSMLRSVEDLFHLRHLGYAQLPGESSFGSDVFACAPSTAPIAVRGRLPAGSEVQHLHVVRRSGKVQLTLYSVGAAGLRIVVRDKARQLAVIKRTLAPCHSYAIGLPAGHGRQVTISASSGEGAQSARLAY